MVSYLKKHKNHLSAITVQMLKTIYTEKRVNNFLNNVEQKIILCKILEIVYTENSEHFHEKTMNSFN